MTIQEKLLNAIKLNPQIQKDHPEISIAAFNGQIELSRWVYADGYQIIINGHARRMNDITILQNSTTKDYYFRFISNNSDRVYNYIDLIV